tara:strand:- start:244 stop:453 length:210 start_codon:yes stop_codon:yes gene_type:complete
MCEKKVNIIAKGASQKQWSVILLELNLMKKAWRPFGVDLHMTSRGLEKIIEHGTRKYDEKKDKDNSKVQ